MRNRGQGFDTFKLLIAAIVALVILGILASILMNVPIDPLCVQNPVQELTSTVKSAATGLDAKSGKICLDEDEGFSADAIINQLSDVDVTFDCDRESLVCGRDNSPLVIQGNRIDATRRAEFKALVICEDKNHCKIKFTNPR